MELFKNRTTDGTGTEFSYNGGTQTLQIIGDLGGGTVTIEVSVNGADWLVPDNGTFTAEAVKLFTLSGGSKVRATLAGSTAADLTIIIK